MNKVKFKNVSRLLAGAVLALTLWGCSDKPQPDAASGSSQQAALSSDPEAQESGAQLWAENCVRCHNVRSPSEFTPDQWDIIVHHMRDRAGLTANEAEKIKAFLQSASGGS